MIELRVSIYRRGEGVCIDREITKDGTIKEFSHADGNLNPDMNLMCEALDKLQDAVRLLDR